MANGIVSAVDNFVQNSYNKNSKIIDKSQLLLQILYLEINNDGSSCIFTYQIKSYGKLYERKEWQKKFC